MSQRPCLQRHRTTIRLCAPWLGTAILLLSVLATPLVAEETAALDPGLVAVGKSLLRTYCASCHGRGGEGDGPVAESLNVAPSDLTRIAQRNQGTFPVEKMRKVIDGRVKVRGHGNAEMPVWGDVFKNVDVEGGEEVVGRKLDALVEYLRSIQVEDESAGMR